MSSKTQPHFLTLITTYTHRLYLQPASTTCAHYLPAPRMANKQAKDESAGGFAPPEESHCFADTHGVLVTTMIDLPGYRVVKVIGTVYGLSVHAVGSAASLRSTGKILAGGELKAFTKSLYSSRDQAVERMMGECISRNGNAIVAMKFDTSVLMGFAPACAYGTACVVEKIE
ncbi:DUF74 domain protein [Paraphoma chrysanthemicola]|nr:DUF74 domain protein [Paraphoma chrysanthemicola]